MVPTTLARVGTYNFVPRATPYPDPVAPFVLVAGIACPVSTGTLTAINAKRAAREDPHMSCGLADALDMAASGRDGLNAVGSPGEQGAVTSLYAADCCVFYGLSSQAFRRTLGR